MNKLRTSALVFLFVIILFFSSVLIPLPKKSEKKMPSFSLPPASLSVLYREADAIVIASCIHKNLDENGKNVSRFSVIESIDGKLKEGDTFSLYSDASTALDYLLYLAETNEYDQSGYSLLTSSPIPVNEGLASYEGTVFSLENVIDDIENQRMKVTVPSKVYYYGSIASLASSCDEIVIGKVLGHSEKIPTYCRSETKDEVVMSTLDMVFLNVVVENCFSGDLSYGDCIRIIFPPHDSIPVIKETDLRSMTAEAPAFLIPETGMNCIFFLNKSQDKKSSDYFTVNSYEGYCLLIGDGIICPSYNQAMKDVEDLNEFSEILSMIKEGN